MKLLLSLFVNSVEMFMDKYDDLYRSLIYKLKNKTELKYITQEM
jgi:hypothetical protein